ncbi:MAG: hypothetical protein WBB28_07270 [Crinalium sp.]
MTQYKNALTLCLPYNEKLRLLALSVLREECGRELSRQAHYNGEKFSWREFNQQFNRDYGDLILDELVKTIEYLFGLDTMKKIAKRKTQHIEQAQARTIK